VGIMMFVAWSSSASSSQGFLAHLASPPTLTHKQHHHHQSHHHHLFTRHSTTTPTRHAACTRRTRASLLSSEERKPDADRRFAKVRAHNLIVDVFLFANWFSPKIRPERTQGRWFASRLSALPQRKTTQRDRHHTPSEHQQPSSSHLSAFPPPHVIPFNPPSTTYF
jgi:hypothetical protein